MHKKVDFEYPAFKDYFVIKLDGKVSKLLCNDIITILEAHNIYWYYQIHYSIPNSQESKPEKWEDLKWNFLS